MPRPYQRRSSTEWLALVEAHQQSGLSSAQFCDQNNISYASFYKWKKRYSFSEPNTAPQQQEGDFIDLSSITSTPGLWNITLSLGDGIELTLNRSR